MGTGDTGSTSYGTTPVSPRFPHLRPHTVIITITTASLFVAVTLNPFHNNRFHTTSLSVFVFVCIVDISVFVTAEAYYS